MAPAHAAPPVIEISDARPLFIFAAPQPVSSDTAAYAETLLDAWNRLPESFRPYSAYSLDVLGQEMDAADRAFLLSVLHDHGIAVSVTVAGGDRALSPDSIRELLASNANVVAVHAAGVPLQGLASYGGVQPVEPAPEAQWLARTLDHCAAHGRFLSLQWETVDWLRILSQESVESVYRTLRYYAPYAVLIHPMQGATALTGTSAIMGLWMEGAGDHWGVRLSPQWYESTDFVRPGQWGHRDAEAHAPPTVYRAMVLAGAMGGATVYRFEDAHDLWYGDRGYQWAESIAPTLKELVDLGAIPRRDVAARRVKLAYQCGTESNPVSIGALLGENSAAFGDGGVERHVYGVARPRVSPDLVPDRADHYFVPLISPYAGIEVTQQFSNIMLPGLSYTDEEWTRLLGSIPTPAAEGTATVVQVGRSVFVMHNRENAYERQTYRIPEMPAPVRGIKIRRTAEGVELDWPFRENDFSYTVYRRILPELTFEPIARNLDVRSYLDTTAPAGETVAYAITALTNEPEPIEGAVNWGEYRVYSAAVSRIEEEVIVLPETEIAISSPVTVVSKDYPDEQPLWPAINGLSVEDTETALQVANRLEMLKRAVAAEDAEYAGGLFAREYQATDGSNTAFVARFFQGFFDRYDRCELFLQPHDWFVEAITEPRVSVTLYANISGVYERDGLPELKQIAGIAAIKLAQRDGEWRIISAESPFPALVDVAP